MQCTASSGPSPQAQPSQAAPDLWLQHAAYMDRNGDGWISASELSHALQDNGISVDAATIASLIAADFKGPAGSEPQISAAAFKVASTQTSRVWDI